MARRPSNWVVAYIDSKKLKLLERDLSKHPKYRLIKAYIPTIKVLKKQFKGEDHFDEIPLLFNYGFFEVPEYFIPNSHFLDMMFKDIECIYGWVKNPANFNKKNPNNIALASTEEIERVVNKHKSSSIHSADDIKSLQIGQLIILQGYPFEGLTAEVVAININKKEVEVRLLLQTHMNVVKVSFDNVFYTIYKSQYMNTEMREKSLDEMQHNSKYKREGSFMKSNPGSDD